MGIGKATLQNIFDNFHHSKCESKDWRKRTQKRKVHSHAINGDGESDNECDCVGEDSLQ